MISGAIYDHLQNLSQSVRLFSIDFNVQCTCGTIIGWYRIIPGTHGSATTGAVTPRKLMCMKNMRNETIWRALHGKEGKLLSPEFVHSFDCIWKRKQKLQSNATFHVRILFQQMYWKCRIMAKATVVKLCSRQLSFSWVFFVVVVVAEHAKGWWTRLVLKDNNCFLGQVWPPNQHHREQRKQSNKSLFTQYFHCCGVLLLLNQEGGVWNLKIITPSLHNIFRYQSFVLVKQILIMIRKSNISSYVDAPMPFLWGWSHILNISLF